MKKFSEGGLQEVSSLKNRVARALGRNEISKHKHDALWQMLDDLERCISQEEDPIAPTEDRTSSEAPRESEAEHPDHGTVRVG